ncbi:MAG: DUF3450 domain-containing protein [Proteobacteria bacterium]|nr:DUF3450 domain-containing protein [Pseudomonadota bacterium]
MIKQRIHSTVLSLLLMVGLMGGGSAWAAALSDLYKVADEMNRSAKSSQAKIDALTEETRELLSEYKTVLKEIEGLQVYNAQLEKQIGNQERELKELSTSIDEVTIIERQVTPLMIRMIDGLEQFVNLDMPFRLDERMERIDRLREMMDRADVVVSEKFNQVLNAYQIENEFGRTMESYSDTINVDGKDRKVDILKVGRISLVYQTPDGAESGVWNTTADEWQTLSDDYKSPIQTGIRMANQQLSVGLLTLPVKGPENK